MSDFHIYRGKLPHWRQEGATYWVDWNLLPDSAPLSSQERTCVQKALCFFEGNRYELSGYVVMDDHVHLLVYPLEGHALEDILHSWKSFTANQMQKRVVV